MEEKRLEKWMDENFGSIARWLLIGGFAAAVVALCFAIDRGQNELPFVGVALTAGMFFIGGAILYLAEAIKGAAKGRREASSLPEIPVIPD